MVAIKGMKKQTDCKKCPLMGTDGNPKDLFSPMMCIAIWATTHEKKHCVGGKVRDDCPLVEIEERKEGKWEYKQLGFRAYGIVCTNCGYVIHQGYDFTSMKEFKDMVERKLQDPHITMDKFCCKCGAEMRGNTKRKGKPIEGNNESYNCENWIP